MIQISGGKSALWWEQKRQMSGGKCDKLGGGKSDKGKWTTALFLAATFLRTFKSTFFLLFPIRNLYALKNTQFPYFWGKYWWEIS